MNKTFSISLCFTFSFLCIVGTLLFSCSQDGEGGYWKSIPSDGNLQAVEIESSAKAAIEGKIFCNGDELEPSAELACCKGINKEEPYNPSIQMCKDGEVTATNPDECANSETQQCCNGKKFNPEMSFCFGSDVFGKCGGKEYNPLTQFCYDTPGYIAAFERCGGKDYNPTERLCCGNVIFNPSTSACCGGNTIYSSSTQTCNDKGEVLNNKTDECGGKKYEPTTQECCNGNPLTKSTQFCYNNGIIEKCVANGTKDTFNPEVQFCFNGTTLLDKCNGEEYDAATQKCDGNIVKNKCGAGWFNAKTQFCQSGTNQIFMLCNGATYASTQFCSNNGITEKCGGEEYYAPQKCEGNIVKTPCGTGWFNAKTQFCQSETNAVKELCNGQTYKENEKCEGGNVTTKLLCGDKEFDSKTQFCQNPSTSVVKELCNGQTYTASQFCGGKPQKPYPLCGSNEYDPTEQDCCGTEIFKPLEKACCKGSGIFNTYNSSTQVCKSDGNVVNRTDCGGMLLDPTDATKDCCSNQVLTTSTQFCNGNTIYNKCSGSKYNPLMEFCLNGTTTPKCNGLEYNANQKCEDNIIKTKCGNGNEYYDAKNEFCDSRSNQIYKGVKIGDQIWMSKNLNYAIGNSGCYNDDPANCTKYGRLYDWRTAMNISSNYNSELYSALAKHKGVCPDGWHIPSTTEFDALITSVSGGNYSSGGAKLKSKTSDWNTTGTWGTGKAGTDDYGFSGLPGGFCLGSVSVCLNIGMEGDFWTSNEYSASQSYNKVLYYHSNVLDSPNSGKNWMMSIRCLKD